MPFSYDCEVAEHKTVTHAHDPVTTSDLPDIINRPSFSVRGAGKIKYAEVAPTEKKPLR